MSGPSWRAFFLVAVGATCSLALGCGDTKAPRTTASSCLDTPPGLPRPPTAELPCELLPPGFTPPR